MPSITLKSSAMATASTVMAQYRQALIQNETPVYRVSNHVQARGHLPDVAVFVMEIMDTAVPTQDVLARVASPADFFAYTSTREASVAQSLRFYRASSWEKDYETLEQAIQGAAVTKDAVDALVQDWATFAYQFGYGPPGELYFLPTSNTGTLKALIDAWMAALSSKEASSAALAAANKAYTDAQTLLTDLTSRRDTLKTLKDNLVTADAVATGFKTLIDAVAASAPLIGSQPLPLGSTLGQGTGVWKGINDLLYVIQNTGSVPTAVTTERDNFVNSKGVPPLQDGDNVFGTPLTNAKALYQSFATEVGNATSLYTAAQSAVTAAETALRAARAVQLEATEDYTAAAANEANCLAAVYAACPDFDQEDPLGSL